MIKLRHGWYCATLTALSLTGLLAGQAPAQTLRVQQKSTAKDSAKKNLKTTPPKSSNPAPVIPVKPPIVITNSTTVQGLPGLSHINYSLPGIQSYYPITAANLNAARYSIYFPNTYPNVFMQLYLQQLASSPNPYLSVYQPISPIAYYPQYQPLPYYNTLYTTYSPNPNLNVNPAFMPYNSLFNVSPYSNPYSLDATLPNFTLPNQQPAFGGGLLNGGLLYRGFGY